MEEGIVYKSKLFAIRIVKLYKYLTTHKNEYVLSKQLLRSGTSIGANVKEAERGQSKPDFATKMNIALKEASESEYWLELLLETEYLNNEEAESILKDCREIIALLMAIVKTTFININIDSNIVQSKGAPRGKGLESPDERNHSRNK